MDRQADEGDQHTLVAINIDDWVGEDREDSGNALSNDGLGVMFGDVFGQIVGATVPVDKELALGDAVLLTRIV